MPDASTTGKKMKVSGADTNERSDRQGPVGENQRTSSAHVPDQRTHFSNLTVVVSPKDPDPFMGRYAWLVSHVCFGHRPTAIHECLRSAC